ncbi:MAG TPA: cupin domain-containing protein [Thermoanaerobaculia bacterium]|jgi:mannose-6-phosphate isomerase-like protein (cupin superfamily)
MPRNHNTPARELETLATLVPELRADRSIDETEGLERRLKTLLLQALRPPVSAATARRIAELQNAIGFIPKFKSYSIKASLPLGYSVFLHNEREGFSFQQHTSHKVEVFHILEAMPGAYVFLCPYPEWQKVYDPSRFGAWMNGEADPALDCFRFTPRPGDVFRIDQLGIVHTVIGCILEEFANTSTDMVDRLHDQNAGRRIPPSFSREYMEERIASIVLPEESCHVLSDGTRVPLDVERFEGGHLTTISPAPLVALRGTLEPHGSTPTWQHPEVAATLHIWAGSGELVLGDEAPLPVTPNSVFLIPPTVPYRLVNGGESPLQWSEQRLPLEQAFV